MPVQKIYASKGGDDGFYMALLEKAIDQKQSV